MSPQATSVPPHVQVIQISLGLWASQLVVTAAKIGICDELAGGAKSADELAGPMEMNPRRLHRFMRSLASLGILTQSSDDKFGLAPMGEALKKGAPGSARATVLTMAGPMIARAWGEFEYCLKTGETAMEKIFGMPLFDFIAKDPALAAQFSESMVGVHGGEPPAVAEAYDFSKLGVIVDVGGATGNMLAHILAKYPQPQGVLYDLPHVVTEAPPLLKSKGVEGRVRIEKGSFFESVPSGGDAYIMSHIIHDWKEHQCLTILGNCRKAMKPGAKLLLVESVLPEGDTPHFGKLLDMAMLAIPGGEERTAEEYRALLAKAGLKMTRVVPTASDVSVVEAELA